jgi:hypothetical protein
LVVGADGVGAAALVVDADGVGAVEEGAVDAKYAEGLAIGLKTTPDKLLEGGGVTTAVALLLFDPSRTVPGRRGRDVSPDCEGIGMSLCWGM